MTLDAVERELERQRRQLRGIENRAAADLRRTYAEVYKRLKAHLNVLLTEIQNMEAAGQTVNTSRLVDLWQYNALIDDLEREVFAFGRQASETVSGAQRTATANADGNQVKLLELSTPTPVRAQIATRLISLSPQAINQFVGFAGDGKPLAALFDKIAPEVAQQAKDTISYGIARGHSPRVVATEFRKLASVPLDRALTISRTEMLRAYRSASTEFYKQNTATVTGWYWHAELDDRTCSACAAMNGTFHKVDESFGAHVNCRCSQIPATKSWKELGFDGMDEFEVPKPPSPEDAFNALPESTQRSIMGPGRYDLYKNGQIKLADNVKVTRSKKWGKSHVVKPLKDLA